MKKAVFVLVLTILLLPVVSQAQAQTGEVAEDGPPAAQPTSQFQWSLGLGVISSPRPYVGVDNKITPIPLIELTYKKWYVQGIQAGYHFINNAKFTLDAQVGFVFAGLDPNDSPALEGMNKKDSSVDAGFVFAWKPGKYRLTTAIYTDILGVSNGQQATMDYSRLWMFNRAQWGIMPSVGVVWQSSNMVNYYAGVTPEEARPERPVFIGHSAVNFRSSLFGFFYFTPRIRITGLIRVQRLDDEISQSPIIDESRGFFALVGLTYRFGKLPPRPSS
jgi:outer membrane protein